MSSYSTVSQHLLFYMEWAPLFNHKAIKADILKHVSTKESNLLEDGAVILVAPDENFGDGSEGLDQETPVALRDRLVLVQHRVQIPGR